MAFRVVVGVGILGAGVGVAGTLVATRSVPPRVVRPDPTLQVRTMAATRADVSRSWEGYGTARAMEAAAIPAQVSGVILERPTDVEPGMPIRSASAPEFPADATVRGATLLEGFVRAAGAGLVVRIDPSDYLARLDSAVDQAESTRAQLRSLEIQEARVRELLSMAAEEREIQQRELDRAIEAETQGGSNTSDIERRRATLLVARRAETNLLEQLEQIGPTRAQLEARLRDQASALELARWNLSRTVIASPISGQLQEVMVRPGEWVQVGAPVARVVDLSRIEVPVRVPAEATGAIAVGESARLRVDTRAGLAWEGRVVRLAPEVDPLTRTFTAFVEVDQDPRGEGLLLPGQFVAATIRTRSTQPVLLVPRRIIVDDRVFVASREPGVDGTSFEVARAVLVTPLFNLVGVRPELDPVETQWSAVRMGEALAPGATLIISNLDDLHDGLLVSGRDVGPPPSAAAGDAGPRGPGAGGVR